MLFIGAIGGGEILILTLFALYPAFWLWMIIECATKETVKGDERLTWLLINIFVPFGWLIYMIVRRPKRIKQAGR